MPSQTLARLACAALLALAAVTPATADGLPEPSGQVLLSVGGAIAVTNAPGEARFDRAMLEAMPVTGFETGTIWTDGRSSFAGVALSDLLAALGAEGRVLRATALNDYSVEIPAADAVPGGPIVAYHLDGAEMSVRDKGPLWIVYPYDSAAAYRSETIYSRSIWQLHRLDILP